METVVKRLTEAERAKTTDDISLDGVSPAGRIRYPAVGCPALLSKVEKRSFDIYVDTGDNTWTVTMRNIKTGIEYNIGTVHANYDDVSGLYHGLVVLPLGVQPGLYDLFVTTVEGTCKVPHAVQVYQRFKDYFRFVQLTDTHIGEGWGDNTNVGDLWALINRINRLEKPEFVVITGDLTDSGQEEETKYFKACILKLEVPVFLTPGNHDNYLDVGTPFTDYREWLNPPVLSPGEDQKYCDDYSFDYGNYHFIVFNSGDSYGPTHQVEGLTWIQLCWMKQDQKNAYSNGKTHTFIFTHAPSVPDGKRDENDPLSDFSHYSATNYPPGYYDYDAAFVSWLNGEDPNYPEGQYVEAVIVGHTHQNHIWYGVDLTNIKKPKEKDNPTGRHILSFSDSAFYIETITSCKKYP